MKLSANAIAKAMSLGEIAAVVAAEVDTVTPVHRLPVIGESVAVVHASGQNAGGYSNIMDAPLELTTVTQVLEGVYPYKRVKVASGDVWDVSLADGKGKGAVWITKRVRYHQA